MKDGDAAVRVGPCWGGDDAGWWRGRGRGHRERRCNRPRWGGLTRDVATTNLSKADVPNPADRGEQTQLIGSGTVQPPGDRTQLLTFQAQPEDDTETPSIVAAERPDPGETRQLCCHYLPSSRPRRCTAQGYDG